MFFLLCVLIAPNPRILALKSFWEVDSEFRRRGRVQNLFHNYCRFVFIALNITKISEKIGRDYKWI